MNLLARLFGVGTYVLILMIFCYLILKKGMKSKKILFVYTLILSFMAFFFKPMAGNDLYRIFDIMHIYSNDSLDFFGERLINSTSPIALIYYRLIGKIGIDGFLPAITCFIFYKNVFYVFYDYIKNRKFSNKTMAISLLIIMCNSSFFETISGIRTMLAFSIFIRCFYNEIYKNRSFFINIPFYIIACLIHPIGMIVLIIRFMYIFFSRMSKKSISNILFLIAYLICMVLFFKYGFFYIKGALEISESYLLSSGYSYFWENVNTVLLLVLILFIQGKIKYKNKYKDFEVELYRNKKNSRVYEILTVIFCYEHNIFFRLNNFNLFLNIPIIISGIDYMIKNKKEEYKYVILFALLILAISVSRGNLCSLKFW